MTFGLLVVHCYTLSVTMSWHTHIITDKSCYQSMRHPLGPDTVPSHIHTYLPSTVSGPLSWRMQSFTIIGVFTYTCQELCHDTSLIHIHHRISRVMSLMLTHTRKIYMSPFWPSGSFSWHVHYTRPTPCHDIGHDIPNTYVHMASLPMCHDPCPDIIPVPSHHVTS